MFKSFNELILEKSSNGCVYLNQLKFTEEQLDSFIKYIGSTPRLRFSYPFFNKEGIIIVSNKSESDFDFSRKWV